MDKIVVTNGTVDPDHYGPIGDAARGIASYCDDPQRVHVYTAAFDAIKDILATRTDATPVADIRDEAFLTAYVSADTSIIGIDHPTEAPWQQVYDAHVALRDRLNERLEQEDLCPYKPEAGTNTHPPAMPVAWMIERDDISTVQSGGRICLHYYAEEKYKRGRHYWTPDHTMAKRFATRDAAINETNGDPILRVAEHMWIDPHPPATDVAALVDDSDAWFQVGALKEQLRQANETIKAINSHLPAYAAAMKENKELKADVAALVEALKRIQRIADRCSNLPDTDGLRRAYRDIDVMAQIALAPFTKGQP